MRFPRSLAFALALAVSALGHAAFAEGPAPPATGAAYAPPNPAAARDYGPTARELAVIDAVRAIKPEFMVKRAQAAGATSVFVRVDGLDVRAGVQDGKLTNIRIMHPRAQGVPKFDPKTNFFNIRPRTVAFDANGDYLYTVEASQTDKGQRTEWYQGKQWFRSRVREPGADPNSVSEREWSRTQSGWHDADYGNVALKPVPKASLVPTTPVATAPAIHPILAADLAPVATVPASSLKDRGPTRAELAVLDQVRKLSAEQIISQGQATPGARAALIRVDGYDVLAGVEGGKPHNIRVITPRDAGGDDETLWFRPGVSANGSTFFLEPERIVSFNANGDYLYTSETHLTKTGRTTVYLQGEKELYAKVRRPGADPYSQNATVYRPGQKGPVIADSSTPDVKPIPRADVLAADATPKEYDAVVIGGGPGGLAAAMETFKDLGTLSGKPRVLLAEGRRLPGSDADLANPKEVAGSSLARQQVIALKPEVLKKLKDKLGFELPAQYFKPESPPISAEANAQKAHIAQIAGTAPRLNEELGAPSVATIQINEMQNLLIEHAKKMGVEVEFGKSFEDVSEYDKSGRVSVRLRDADGNALSVVRSKWIAGAGGARDTVREKVGINVVTGETQGQMVGAWFEGQKPGQRDMSRSRATGASGIMLESGHTLYGLFGMPKSMEGLATKRPDQLTEAERVKLYAHIETVARELVGPEEGAQLHVARHLAFPIQLNRAETAVSEKHHTLILGDSNQTTNPFSGRGANLAILEGLEAGSTMAKAIREPSHVPEVLASYKTYAKDGADYLHALSREYYTDSFGTRRPPGFAAQAARIAPIVRANMHANDNHVAPMPRSEPIAHVVPRPAFHPAIPPVHEPVREPAPITPPPTVKK